MNGIYWKSVKQRIEKFFETVHECILIFTDWLGWLHEWYFSLIFLNRKTDLKMKSRNSNLLNVIKFYLFYVSIVLIATPLVVYLISYLSENYLFGRSVSFEQIFKNSVLDDVILILGNLLIILLFIKKGYTNVNKSCCRTAMASFDKGLFLWILIFR